MLLYTHYLQSHFLDVCFILVYLGSPHSLLAPLSISLTPGIDGKLYLLLIVYHLSSTIHFKVITLCEPDV